jgi:YgiT-type zinc finger domain-containing protein
VDSSPTKDTEQPAAPCPRCGGALAATTVRTTIWQGDRVAIVEDIPAHVCEACLEQFYDDAVSEALRRLSEEGFPAAKADREITVPVFSLTGRIQPRPVLRDDTYVD